LATVLDRGVAEEKEGLPSVPQSVRVAVAGATGYSGGELLTLLLRHPATRITKLLRESNRYPDIEGAHPSLRGRGLPVCEQGRASDLTAADADLVFLATPHEAAHDAVPVLLERGLRVIDLSAAFRLKDASAYPRWYGFEHQASATLAEAVYGAPELFADEIRKARVVANPGCYATCVNLSLAPLLKAGLVDLAHGIVADSKSGATGAGRSPSDRLHFPEVHENLRAYGLFHHRHVPEMLQTLGLAERDFIFTPHLLPINRGILSTIYVYLNKSCRLGDVVTLFQDFYAAAPMVRVYANGAQPDIQAVAHTQYFDVGFALDEGHGRLIILSALDNLGKGAAGQAVQNMNLMYGFPEATALI
jgi:N-acetyl-gamma-glutamyl-phosphate reductase